MSSLNSTSENSNLIQILVDGKNLSWEQIRATKVDVAHLERKFELVKPQLQYLGMYQSLFEHFKPAHYEKIRPYLDKNIELAEQDYIRLTGKDWSGDPSPYTLRMTPSGSAPSKIVYLFITKHGHWTALRRSGDEVQFVTCVTVVELCSILEHWSEPGFEYDTPSGYPFTAQISFALDRLVNRRVNERRKQLESMDNLKSDMERLNKRTFGKP